MKRILSLGAGVQSFTLALLIKDGVVSEIDCAIFADTQWEPHWVYEQLEWLKNNVPFPIHTCTGGNLKEHVIDPQQEFIQVPLYTNKGLGIRQCTSNYKIRPLYKKQREIAGLKPRQRVKEPVVESLIGISIDEAHRMKPSRNKAIFNSYPLIDLGLSRNDCLDYLKKNNYPIPKKSSCIGCPYHSDQDWIDIKNSKHWNEMLEIDKAVRVKKNMDLFFHKKKLPLDQIDFIPSDTKDDFGNECEGMCGL